ncbi:MAG: peptide-O-fucosyltransferase, partial [Lysobacterales bacterium]
MTKLLPSILTLSLGIMSAIVTAADRDETQDLQRDVDLSELGQSAATGLLSGTAAEHSPGYLVFCPCMGRLGNQVAHLLGAMAAAHQSGRVLVLPPFIEFSGRETRFVPFETYFSLAAVREFVPAVSLEEFLADEAAWPLAERRLYCPRGGEKTTCQELHGNPQKTFWDYHGVEFVASNSFEFADSVSAAITINLPSGSHPVVAMASSPGSFPVAVENRYLQQYLKWSDTIREQGETFIGEQLIRPILAVHLRNGNDWKRACSHGTGLTEFMSSPQCGYFAGAADGPTHIISEAMCLPGPAEAVRAINAANVAPGPFKSVFIGTDRDDYRAEIKKAVGEDVQVVRGGSPTLDLYIFA